MKKIIWIVAPFTEIETLDTRDRFQYIANELQKNENYEVHLFTSDFVHMKKTYVKYDIASKYSYFVHLIHENGYQKNISIKRALSHISFAKNLMKEINKIDKPNLIFCAYPMMTSAYFIGKYAIKNKIPFILDVQDIWPESISVGISTDNFIVKTLMLPFTFYANRIYKLADLVFGVSQTYVDRAKIKGSKSKEFIPVYIGAEGNKFEVPTQNILKKEEGIWCIYIGTLSHSYDLMTAIETFGELKNKYFNIKLYILGNGPDFYILKEKAKELEILDKTVFLKGMLPYDEMVSYLKKSDIALNAIRGQSVGTITNKFGDFISAGLPILNCCQMKEVLNLIDEKKLGLNYLPENKNSLKEKLLLMISDKSKMKIFSENSKKFANEKFDRIKSYRIIFSKIDEFLKKGGNK